MRDLEPELTKFRSLAGDDLDRLPIPTRIVERLTAILVLTDEMLGELVTEEANAILWTEAPLRRIYDEVDTLIGRLAQ